MENRLLTIAKLAKRLQIPESTVRYYRDRFIDYIPYVGDGRHRRYRPETADLLQFIAEGFDRNLTAIEIEEGLRLMAVRNVEVTEETAMTTAAAQQQSNQQGISVQIEVGEQFQELMKQTQVAMQVMAQQKEEIMELRKAVAELRNQQDKQKEYIDHRLEKRDDELVNAMKEMMEMKKQVAVLEEQKDQKKWWQFWR
jgi:DNA-binding transcriptional MerR regulator